MNKTLWLQNPDGKFVLSATITDIPESAFWLAVRTIYGRSSDCYKTLRGAKMDFGKKFMTGGKWNMTEKVSAP